MSNSKEERERDAASFLGACTSRCLAFSWTAVAHAISVPTLLIYGFSRYFLGPKQVFVTFAYHSYRMLQMSICRHVARTAYFSLFKYDAPEKLMFELVWSGPPFLAYICTTILCRRTVSKFYINVWNLRDFNSWLFTWLQLAKWAATTGLVAGFLNTIIPTAFRRKLIEIGGRFGSKIFSLLVELCHVKKSFLIESYNRLQRKKICELKIPTVRGTRLLYDYQPLIEPDNMIRLVELIRKSPLHDIEIKLTQHYLDKAPDYDAISYAWGNENKTHGLIVDGQWLPTTTNVYKIVQERAQLWGSIYIWIDYICINQGDNIEKGPQVRMMQQIYTKAKQVVVFLGDSDDADVAIYHLKRLYLNIQRQCDAEIEYKRQLAKFVRGRASPGWDAFIKLINHSFWTRVWIVQEVALAKKLRIVYGENELPWDYFVSVLRNFENVQNDGALEVPSMVSSRPKEGLPFLGIARVLLIADIRERFRGATTIHFQDVLCESSKFNATNPRDHIFALEGLVKNSLIDPEMLPNYNKSIESLYTATARHYLLRDDGHWVLRLAGAGYPRKYNNLPSWVPDWSHNRHFTLEPHIQSSVGPAMNHATTSSLNTFLHIFPLECIIVNSIQQISTNPPMQTALNSNIESGPATAQFYSYHRQIIDMALKTDSSTLSNDTESLRLEAVWKTLIQYSPTSAPDVEAEGAMRILFRGWLRSLELTERLFSLVEAATPTTSASITRTLKEIYEEAKAVSSPATRFSFLMGSRSHSQRFAVLEHDNALAMVPPGSANGDLIVRVVGGDVPLVIRREATNDGKDEGYRLMGECFVQSLTGGIWEAEGRRTTTVNLY